MTRAEIVAGLLLSPPNRPEISCFQFFQERPFVWTSGTKHPVYTNNRLFQSMPEARALLTKLLAEQMDEAGLKPEGLAGVFSSAIFHADGLARLLNLPMITVRTEPKGHGSGGVIDGILDKGKNYLIIEDLFSTGGSAIQAAQNIRQEGGLVTHALSIVTYGWEETFQRFKEAEIIPISLVDFPVLLKKAVEMGQVDEKMKVVIADWQHDPLGWAKRHGFE